MLCPGRTFRSGDSGYGVLWVRLSLGVRRFASSSPGPALFQVRLPTGSAFRRTQVGLFWVRLSLGPAICVVVLRSGFISVTADLTGYGFLPHPGRSFPGTAIPGSGDLRRRSQVRLFSGCGDLACPGRYFPGYGFPWVRLFLGTAFSGCTAICVVVPRSGFFQVRLFPRYGFFSGERANA